MNGHEVSFIEKRPQSLCKMCGKCCRVITNTKYTYEEILEMANDGNEYAQDFIKLFEPYQSTEEAREVDADIVDNILKRVEQSGEINPEDVVFYKCKYLLDNNLCSIYEERPTLCKLCPSSGWVVTPPGCGFESWLFLQREEDMEKVRKYKEELLDLKIMKTKTQDEKLLQKIEAVERKINLSIDLFSEHGSQYW